MANYGSQIVVLNKEESVIIRKTLYVDNIVSPIVFIDLDPTGNEDVGPIIQNALNQLSAQGGGVCVLPVGTFLLKTQVNFPQSGKIVIKGQGFNTQIKVADNVNIDAFYISGDRCGIQDLFINGNKDNNSTGSGVYFYNSYRSYLFRVFVHNTAEDGLKSGGTITPKSSLVTTDSCTFENCGRYSIHHEEYSQDPIIENTFTQDAGSYGLYLDGNFGSVVTNSHFFRGSNHNVYCNGGGRQRFENCTIDRSDGWGMIINGSRDVVMSKCILFDNDQLATGSQGGLLLTSNAVNCIVSGNTFYDEQDTPTQSYNIKVDNGCQNNIIVHNTTKEASVSQYNIGTTALSENVIIDSSTAQGIMKILNDTPSSSSNSGCLTLAGGLGVGEDVYINNDLYCDNITATGGVSADFYKALNQTEIPLTGDTITFNNKTSNLLINPAGSLASLTINLPNAPEDGQKITIVSSQAVTSLTVAAPNTNGLLGGSIGSLTAGESEELIYESSGLFWYKL